MDKKDLIQGVKKLTNSINLSKIVLLIKKLNQKANLK